MKMSISNKEFLIDFLESALDVEKEKNKIYNVLNFSGKAGEREKRKLKIKTNIKCLSDLLFIARKLK